MTVDLNFAHAYPVTPTDENMSAFTFETELLCGGTRQIVVEIQQAKNDFLDEFLNLAYGPRARNGGIDDFASVPHLNYSKAFSTVLFCGLSYLKQHPADYIGFSGSDFRRAYLYFRILQHNYDYLACFFQFIGIKYFVRLLQGSNKNDTLNLDPGELLSLPYPVSKGPLQEHKSLFNFIMFCLNL